MFGYNSQRIPYLAGAIALAYCIILGSQVASAKKLPLSTYVNIIDNSDIDFIAEIVCEIKEGNEYQIAEIDTFYRLFTFFEKLPATHKLFEQHDWIMGKLRPLKELLDQKPDSDICGGESIDALLKYHRKYISKLDDSFAPSSRHLPRVLELFFINYLYEVSLTCKDNLIKKLDSPKSIELNFRMIKEQAESLGELDRLNDKFSVLIGGKSSNLSKFYDVVLLWSVLDKSPLGPDIGKFSEPTYYNNYQRLAVATPEAEKIIRVQKECKALKPLYESPLLAVVRLIDVGYYLDDEPFAAHLLNRANLRRLIGLVIICETIEPVGVIQDDSLKVGKNVLLSNKEAKDYPEGREIEVDTPKFNYKITPRNYKLASRTLRHVTPGTAYAVVEKLNVNLRDREKFVKRIFRSYMGRWKLQIKAFFTKLFSMEKKEQRDLFPTDVLPLFEMLI